MSCPNNCGTCDECSNCGGCEVWSFYNGIEFTCDDVRTLCNDSDVYFQKGQCDGGCDRMVIDWCEVFGKNVFYSSDDSVDVQTISTVNGQGVTTCKLDLTTNDDFQINGYSVFCKDPVHPNRRKVTFTGAGVNITPVLNATTGCYDFLFDVNGAAFASELGVGYGGTSLASLTPLKNPSGRVGIRLNANHFTQTTSKDPVSLTNDNIWDISLKSTPIFSVNGVSPDVLGNFRICNTSPIEVTASATQCGGLPGTNISLKYNTSQFENDVTNGLQLIQTKYLKGGKISSPATIDPRLEASGTPISGDPDWSVGGTTMDIWEKVVGIGNITIPYTAPAGYVWCLDIGIHVDAYPLFPSAGTPGDVVSGPGVVQAKAYVNNSLTADYSGQQRECSPYTLVAGTDPSRGDGEMRVVSITIPQTSGLSFPVSILLQYSTPAATKDTMYRVETSETSYSGFLELIKTP